MGSTILILPLCNVAVMLLAIIRVMAVGTVGKWDSRRLGACRVAVLLLSNSFISVQFVLMQADFKGKGGVLHQSVLLRTTNVPHVRRK
jgi:hypothetical protein